MMLSVPEDSSQTLFPHMCTSHSWTGIAY